MSTLTRERHWWWRLHQFGGGYGATGITRTEDFNLVPITNGFFTIHASLARASGGGEAAIGIAKFVDKDGQTVVAASEVEWVPVALTRSGEFTLAALARGAAMTGSVRIQAWRD